MTLLLLVSFTVLLSAQKAIPPLQKQGSEKIFDVKKIEVEGDFLNSNIRCAYKDSRGFMWFGTAHGLCRYDGNGIIEFTTNNSKLPFNDISKIYEDDQGHLWILNDAYSVVVENIAFVDISTLEVVDLEDKFKIDFPSGFWVVEGKDNIIYLTENTQIKYSYSKGKLSQSKNVAKYDGNYSSLYELFNENLDKGIVKFFYDEKIDYTFTPLSKDEQGKILTYSYSGGYGEKKFRKIDASGNLSNYEYSLSDKLLKNISNVRPNHRETERIWSFSNYELSLWDTKKNILHDFRIDYPELFYDRIFNIEFHDDLVWVCAANGVFSIKIEKKHFDTQLKRTNLSKKFNSCRSIYVNNHEDIMVATVSELIHLTPEGEKIIFKANHSPFIDKKNDTLILGNGGVYYYLNNEIQQVATVNEPIWSVEKASNDEGYWLGQDNGLGYWKEGMDTVAIYDKMNGYDELKTATIYDLYTVDNGNILMATSLGIYELSPEAGVIQKYWKEGTSKYHLPLNEYYYIYQDEDGIFWLGSGGGGLIKWNKETGDYQQYTTENGFSSNLICAIYEDEEKNLWLPSYNGLIQFNKETEKIRIYKTEDGLTHNEFNRGAHFQTADGKLYFGGVNGINSFYPKKLLEEDKLESIHMEVVSLYHFNSRQDKLIDKLELFQKEKKITLKPNEGFINIEFSLLDYRKKGVTTYAYKIEGQSDKWQYVKDNQLRISGLPYGEYKLRIKGQMNNGSFSDKELLIPMEILRPFYLQIWFIISACLAFVFGFYRFSRWRNKRLIQRGEELEKQVNEQTQQLQKDKGIIQKQATELREIDKLKSRFFANVSHELRTPITLIQGPVRSVLNNENLDENDKFLLTKVEENAEHLLGMVNELMDLTKAEAYKLKLDESNVIFYDLLKRRLSSFQSLADMNSIRLDLEYHADKDLRVALDTDKFEKIINNLLSNAFKFTSKEGKIKVIVHENKNDLQLEVKDTGRGIPQTDLPFVFNRFYQSSINKKAEGGLGIGLSLSMEFVKLLGGEMWVESKEGQGSTFFVSLPKKEIEDVSVDELTILDKEKKSPKLEIENLINSSSTTAAINSDFLSKQMILIVEDNLDLQEYLHYLLAPHYYEIHVVNNGKEALEWIAANKPPSLILSDLMMPIMDGFELLEQVKADKKLNSIPFVMLTARADLRDKLKALRIGVDDYLTKPFKEEELKVRINNLLSNFEERKEYLMSEQPTDTVSKKEYLLETSNDDIKWLENLEKTIIEEIEHHYFSIDYLAEKIDVKRDKLFKKTKALTGLTPNKYVRAVRLQLAKELLENKSYRTVKEVAHKVGFQKIEYFSTLYKKQFGKSPSEYIR